MGYLFPGLLILYILYYLYSCDWNFYQVINLDVLSTSINRIGDKFVFEKSLLVIIFAYAIGHIISFTSSLTVEILSNKFFGYPSKYLLQDERPIYSKPWKDFFNIKVESTNKIWRIIKSKCIFLKYLFLLLLLFPISFMILTFGYLFNINQYIIRPLDKYLINGIKTKQQDLAKRIGLKLPNVIQDCDYHRIIMHYVYLNIPACQHKVDNYIALYGFLRCMTLIFCILFDVFATFGIITIFKNNYSDVCWPLIWTILIFFSISYISFLAFVKFYRRQTLENFMSMLTGIPHDINEGNNTTRS